MYLYLRIIMGIVRIIPRTKTRNNLQVKEYGYFDQTEEPGLCVFFSTLLEYVLQYLAVRPSGCYKSN